MSETIKLEPCPFCGGRPDIVDPIPLHSGGYISCDDCGATSMSFKDEAHFIAAWNRRALSSKDAEIEALRTRAESAEALLAEAVKALEQIATGEIVGEPHNYRDTVGVMRGIARSTLSKIGDRT